MEALAVARQVCMYVCIYVCVCMYVHVCVFVYLDKAGADGGFGFG